MYSDIIWGDISLSSTTLSLTEDWGSGGPDGQGDNFSIEYFYYFKAPITGDFYFCITPDNTATAFMNDAEIINAISVLSAT